MHESGTEERCPCVLIMSVFIFPLAEEKKSKYLVKFVGLSASPNVRRRLSVGRPETETGRERLAFFFLLFLGENPCRKRSNPPSCMLCFFVFFLVSSRLFRRKAGGKPLHSIEDRLPSFPSFLAAERGTVIVRGCVADLALVHTESKLRGVSGVIGGVDPPDGRGSLFFLGTQQLNSRVKLSDRGAIEAHAVFCVRVRIAGGAEKKYKKRLISKRVLRLSSNFVVIISCLEVGLGFFVAAPLPSPPPLPCLSGRTMNESHRTALCSNMVDYVLLFRVVVLPTCVYISIHKCTCYSVSFKPTTPPVGLFVLFLSSSLLVGVMAFAPTCASEKPNAGRGLVVTRCHSCLGWRSMGWRWVLYGVPG